MYEGCVCVLPQTEVVSKVYEGSHGRASSEHEHFERHLLGVGKGAVLDAVGALEVCIIV